MEQNGRETGFRYRTVVPEVLPRTNDRAVAEYHTVVLEASAGNVVADFQRPERAGSP